MKRVLTLILAAVMVVCSLASCSTLKDEDKGAIITIFLTDEIYNFDPTQSYTNDSLAQITSLTFEGLTVLNAKGDWEKGMMKSYKKLETKDGGMKLQIELRQSKWSDGRFVQANDFVYAWQRILEPSFACDAACLLYDIKNAADIKMGNVTVDDLGAKAVETYVLEIEFEHDMSDADIDAFLRSCASPALVPMRVDKVGTNEEWAMKSTTMVTNGPFDVRKIEYGSELRLERSGYYYRDTESNQALDKYVIPYRLVIKYSNGDEKGQLEKYNAEELFYLGDIALASRGEYAKEAEVSDSLNTHTYFFNTENELFSDARVRRALSMAIDREAIASALTFAKAATGFVPAGIADETIKKDFRENADRDGKLLSTTADIEGARSLLREAGVTKGSFSITVRDDELDIAVAEIVKEAWSSLGFTVKIKELGGQIRQTEQANESAICDDLFQIAYNERDFDVIAVDCQMLANDAYALLAPFAAKYSGAGVDMSSVSSNTYDAITHITGYNESAYSDLIDSVFSATDASERSKLLHEAEAKLLEDAPVCPVVFLQNAYLINGGVLSGMKTSFWGTSDFRRVKMKNYMKYKEEIEAQEFAEMQNAQ